MSHESAFDDVVAANAEYVQQFRLDGLPPRASRGLAVLTCMDSRIEPLAMLGLAPGDAKILRNAGARVTDDVVRTFVLGHYLLGVERIMIVAHTRCRMASTEDEVRAAAQRAGHEPLARQQPAEVPPQLARQGEQPYRLGGLAEIDDEQVVAASRPRLVHGLEQRARGRARQLRQFLAVERPPADGVERRGGVALEREPAACDMRWRPGCSPQPA